MPVRGCTISPATRPRRSGEWLTGIARVMQARFSDKAEPLVRPYLDIVRAFSPGRELTAYPGSPLIARALLRPQDSLVACELEPIARKQPDRRRCAAITQARVVDLDGWVGLPAFVPPKERRGLVLIDPPFERKDEFERVAAGFAAAFAKWPGGVYLIWYPVKSRRATDTLARDVAGAASPRSQARQLPAAGIQRRAATAEAGLVSTGLLIVNPPWTLAGELRTLLPELEKPLGLGGAARFRLEVAKP